MIQVPRLYLVQKSEALIQKVSYRGLENTDYGKLNAKCPKDTSIGLIPFLHSIGQYIRSGNEVNIPKSMEPIMTKEAAQVFVNPSDMSMVDVALNLLKAHEDDTYNSYCHKRGYGRGATRNHGALRWAALGSEHFQMSMMGGPRMGMSLSVQFTAPTGMMKNGPPLAPCGLKWTQNQDPSDDYVYGLRYRIPRKATFPTMVLPLKLKLVSSQKNFDTWQLTGTKIGAYRRNSGWEYDPRRTEIQAMWRMVGCICEELKDILLRYGIDSEKWEAYWSCNWKALI